MRFSRDQKTEQSKKPSMASFLFKPDIGESIRPIGESANMFVLFIAWLFSLHGLFPQNHPALMQHAAGDPQPRLTLGDVLATGWGRLEFTRATLWRTVIYFSVILSLAFGVFVAFMLLMAVMSGHVRAEDASSASTTASTAMFTSNNESTDIAHNVLNYLFKAEAMPATVKPESGYGNWFGAAQSTVIQTSLETAMAYYSGAILVVGSIVLLYHLVNMIAETAHTGKIMGNANQIWAPIRLVFAIGLLVPIGGGLNTGQYLVVKIADWGSGLASNTWEQFSTALASSLDNQFSVPPSPDVVDAVKAMALNYACVYAYNHYVADASVTAVELDSTGFLTGTSSTSTGTTETTDEEIAAGQYIQNLTSYVGYDKIVEFGPLLEGYKTLCGEYWMPSLDLQATYTTTSNDISQDLKQAILKSNETAFKAMQDQAKDVAITFMQNYFATHNTGEITATTHEDFFNVVKTYRESLLSGVKDAIGSTSSNAAAKLTSAWSKLGWMSAGAWFNVIARAQEKVSTAAWNVPKVRPPMLFLWASSSEDGHLSTVERQTVSALEEFASWMDQGFITKTIDVDNLATDGQSVVPPTLKNPTSDVLTLVMVPIRQILIDMKSDKDAEGNKHLICPGCPIGTTANPLAELAQTGQSSFVTAFKILDNIFYLGLATDSIQAALTGGGAFAKSVAERAQNAQDRKVAFYGAGTAAGVLKGLGSITATAGGILMTLGILFATLFFTAGVTLGFVLPMLPFTLFFFNTLTWMVSVFEAVVSAPLWSLAHLTTKGEGIHGDAARAGYFMLFSIFLRPVLMVFGLIAGILIFYAAISILNLTYSIAVHGILKDSLNLQKITENMVVDQPLEILAHIVFYILYSMMAYICANTAFKPINFFPEHAMRWMSAQGVSTERMGDKQLMSMAQTAMTGYLFKDTLAGTLGKGSMGFLAASEMGRAAPKMVSGGQKVKNAVEGMLEKTGILDPPMSDEEKATKEEKAQEKSKERSELIDQNPSGWGSF